MMHKTWKRMLGLLLTAVLVLSLFPAAFAAEDLAEISLPNGDFETGDASNWVLSGLPDSPVRQNSYNTGNTSWTLNLWTSNDAAVEIHASYPVKLTAGSYKFSFLFCGDSVDSQLRWSVRAGDQTLIQQADTVTGVDWKTWIPMETEEFTLSQTTEVVFDFGGTGPVGCWGDLDELKLFGTGAIAPSDVVFDHKPTLAVERVRGVDSEDFIRGTDVSSYVSLIRSGAKFYDYEGNALTDQGFFDLLAGAGFNYIRIRVWNDPYDANGNGYGGGNNDLETAKLLGQWATNAGMKVLIDFHYSDFWADPGKQFVPKAWSGFTVEQKSAAMDAFTYDSLAYLLDNGVDVGMVQVGNETTSKICGEGSWSSMAQLFNAGSAAVRRLAQERDREIRVAIHFTNPEKTSAFTSLAANLNRYNVDYDVLGTSWYPYWHGDTANLSAVLKTVADSYGKEVMVAETSWAWSLEDGDGWANTVSHSGNNVDMPYAFSVQGQANELVAAAKAVTAVGDKGLGVFYWENAWIPVQYAYDEDGTLDQDILASNNAKWEQFGSGWASSFAGDYQEDAAQWHGGSAVDNQAMFDFQGRALDSLWTWNYMRAGTLDAVDQRIESIQAPELVLEAGDSLNLPETVQVVYLVGNADEPVTWDAADLAAVDVNTPGVYTVGGTVSTQVGDQPVTLTITVLARNLIVNPGFEDSNLSMYSVHTGGSRSTQDVRSGSYSYHFYSANGGTVDLAQELQLEPGEYSFSLYTQGEVNGVDGQYISVRVGNQLFTQDFTLLGWNNWQHPVVSFTVPKTCTVTAAAHLPYGNGGWGAFDDLYLSKTGELTGPVTIDDIDLRSSVSLGSDLTVRYKLVTDSAFEAYGFDSFYLEFCRYDWAGNVISSLRYGEGQEAALDASRASVLTLRNSSIPAAEMNSLFGVSFHGFRGEVEFRTEPEITSLRDYFAGQLETLSPEDQDGEAQLRLAADLLRYGAAAQAAFGYDLEHPVLEGLSEAAQAALAAYGTQGAPDAQADNVILDQGLAKPSISLSLQSKLELKLRWAGRTDGQIEAHIWSEEDPSADYYIPAAPKGSIWTALCDQIGSAHVRDQYHLVMLKDGSPVTNEAIWSVAGYVAAQREAASEPMQELYNALLAYGDSVINRFGD